MRFSSVGRSSARLDQQRSDVFAKPRIMRRQAGLALNGTQGRAVQQFDGGYRLHFEGSHGLAGGLDRGKKTRALALWASSTTVR